MSANDIHRINVLVAGAITSRSRQQLEKVRDIEVHYSGVNDTSSHLLHSIRILVTRYGVSVGSSELERMPNLEVVVQASTGYDNIDLAALRSRGVEFILADGASTVSVAEHTIMFALMLCKQSDVLIEKTRLGLWTKPQYRGEELFGKTFGVVGFGRIGKQVARYAKAIGMDVIVYDPFLGSTAFESESVVEQHNLDDLLTKADIVSLHVPLNASTRNMVSREFLKSMKTDAYLINTSRGGVVDEYELANALKAKMIKGAALDVFKEEPLSDNSLCILDNVICTPHVAGVTAQSLENACTLAVARVEQWILQAREADNVF